LPSWKTAVVSVPPLIAADAPNSPNVDASTSSAPLLCASLLISKTVRSHGIASLPQWTTILAPVRCAVASCSAIIFRKNCEGSESRSQRNES
jgi:hypothetical protein